MRRIELCALIAVLLLADVSLGEGAGELFQPVVRVARSQPLTEQPTAAQPATAQPPAVPRSPVTGQPPATAQPTTTLPATQPATSPQGQQSLPSLGGRLFTREFGDITTDIRQRVGPRGNDTLPVDMARQDNLFVAPGEQPLYSPVMSTFAWVAPEIWHKSLYFDDIQLERYGQSRAPLLQPFLSGAHFFGTLPILPYKMGLNGPFEMIPNLGYYRPGSPTPCVGRRLPWEWDAAFYEAAFWTGSAFIFP